MSATQGQLLQDLRWAIADGLRNRFSLKFLPGSPIHEMDILESSTDWMTESLADDIRHIVELQGYLVADVQLSTWFVDELITEDNGEPFARFALTNNSRYGRLIIVSVNSMAPKR